MFRVLRCLGAVTMSGSVNSEGGRGLVVMVIFAPARCMGLGAKANMRGGSFWVL